MKPLRLPQLLMRGFWFVALLVGVFYLVERIIESEERRTLARYALVPDTIQELKVYFAQIPDTIFFAEEAFPLNDEALRARIEERYYYWTLTPSEFIPLLRRSYRWGRWIRDALMASGLPQELIYLAAQRSHLDPKQRGARAGLWALDTTEANALGLEVGNCRDERLDLFRSTSALADTLQSIRSTSRWTEALAQFCGDDPRLPCRDLSLLRAS